MSCRTLLTDSTPSSAFDGVARGGRELGVAVLRGDDQVGLDLALDRVTVRDAQAVGQDGDERHQRDSDHQRCRGRGRSARIALRVAFGELSGRAADVPRRDAHDAYERTHEPRRQHGGPEEQRENADAEQRESVTDGDVVGERSVAEREDRERHDRRPRCRA